MARIFQTGFETGSNSAGVGGGGTIVTTPVAGSWSTYALSGGGSPTIQLGTTVTELYFGFRFYRNGGTVNQRFMRFITPNGTDNVSVWMDGAGNLSVYRGDHVTLLGSAGPTVLTQGIWYYVEFYALISDTVGKIQLKINGVDEVALTTGLDTRADAAAGGDVISAVGFTTDTGQFIVDDLYINDTTSTRNTGFSGDIRVSVYIPNAAGDSTGLTPTAGANYTNIDERPPNDATDIVSATGTTLYDLYNIPNTSGIATVQAVYLWLRAQKSDAGAKNVAHVVKYDTDASGTADTENVGSDVALSTSWAYYGKVYNDDPGNTAWSAAKIDALQIGAKAR